MAKPPNDSLASDNKKINAPDASGLFGGFIVSY